MNPKVNDGLGGIMCQCMFITVTNVSFLVGDANNGGRYAQGGVGVHGKSLHLQFCCKPKSSLKNSSS